METLFRQACGSLVISSASSAVRREMRWVIGRRRTPAGAQLIRAGADSDSGCCYSASASARSIGAEMPWRAGRGAAGSGIGIREYMNSGNRGKRANLRLERHRMDEGNLGYLTSRRTLTFRTCAKDSLVLQRGAAHWVWWMPREHGGDATGTQVTQHRPPAAVVHKVRRRGTCEGGPRDILIEGERPYDGRLSTERATVSSMTHLKDTNAVAATCIRTARP